MKPATNHMDTIVTDPADNLTATMYIIRNHDSAADLYYYAGTNDQPGRYGWGPEDLIEGRASQLVEFELAAEAWDWIETHENFCRGAVAIPLPDVKTSGKGRPRTGKAMTPAERKRAQRNRDQGTIGMLLDAPHKVPPRVIVETLHAGNGTLAFHAWLELGERRGWLSSAQRIALRDAQLNKT